MKTLIAPSQLTDEHTVTEARHAGRSLQFYDDGFGPLFVHRDSMGITGVIRAQTWEDAYSIYEDEFAPAATETEAELIADYGENFEDSEGFQESFGYRGSPRREPDGSTSLLYSKDLNGDRLDSLTDDLAAALEIEIEAETPEPERPEDRWHVWHLQRRPVRNRTFLALWSGRYGTSSSVCSKYLRSPARMTRHEMYSPTREDPTRPEFNPEA
jgi:hypothetical protein